jgi:hypothetical protein
MKYYTERVKQFFKYTVYKVCYNRKLFIKVNMTLNN